MLFGYFMGCDGSVVPNQSRQGENHFQGFSSDLGLSHVEVYGLSLTPVVPYASRAHLCLDLQRVPILRASGQPPLRFAGDWQSVHREGGSFRCGKLHLRGDKHGDQQPGPGPPNPTHPQERW